MNRFSIAQLMLVGTYVGLVALLFIRWQSYLENEPKFIEYSSGVRFSLSAPLPWDVLFAALALGIWFAVWVWTCFNAWRRLNRQPPQ